MVKKCISKLTSFFGWPNRATTSDKNYRVFFAFHDGERILVNQVSNLLPTYRIQMEQIQSLDCASSLEKLFSHKDLEIYPIKQALSLNEGFKVERVDDPDFYDEVLVAVSYTHSPSPRDRQKSRMPSSA